MSSKQETPRKPRRRKLKQIRKTFALDEHTLRDLREVQLASRATSETEAVRISVQKMARLIRLRHLGAAIPAVSIDGSSVAVDIPGGAP